MSMIRKCDAGAFCLQRPQCEYRCHFTDAALEPEQETLKIAASTVPEDLDVAQEWHTMGSILLGVALSVLLVFFLLIFFTGMWIWSLLI